MTRMSALPVLLLSVAGCRSEPQATSGGAAGGGPGGAGGASPTCVSRAASPTAGACPAGPPVRLAAVEGIPKTIAVDSGHVYLLGDDALVRVGKRDGAVDTFPGRPRVGRYGLVVASPDLYVAVPGYGSPDFNSKKPPTDGRIDRFSTVDGQWATAVDNQALPRSVWTFGGDLFFINEGTVSFSGGFDTPYTDHNAGLFRLRGGQVTPIVSRLVGAYGYAAVGDQLYWMGDTAQATSMQSLRSRAVSTLLYGTWPTAVDECAFFAQGPYLLRQSTGGGDVSYVTGTEVLAASDIVDAGASLLLSTTAEARPDARNAIVRVAKANGALDLISQHTAAPGPLSIDGTCAYWFADSALWQVRSDWSAGHLPPSDPDAAWPTPEDPWLVSLQNPLSEMAVTIDDRIVIAGTIDWPIYAERPILDGVPGGFIQVLERNGRPLRTIVSAGSGSVRGVAIGAAGDIFAVGNIALGADPDPSDGKRAGTYLAAFDSTGTPHYEVAFDQRPSAQGFDVVVDPAGNPIVLGAYQPDAPYGDDVFVRKLDRNGQTTWTALIATALTQGTYAQPRLAFAPDGGVFAAFIFNGGVVVGGTTVAGLDQQGLAVLRFNADGALLWSRTFQGTASGTIVLTGLAVSAQTGDVVLVGGVRDSVDFGGGPIGPASPNSGSRWAFLLRLSAAGAHVHSAAYGGLFGNNLAVAAAITPEDNVLFAGDNSGDVFEAGGTQVAVRVYVMEVDPTGQVVSARPLAAVAGADLNVSSIVMTARGDIFFGGSSLAKVRR